MSQPLAGLIVLDFSHVVAGPFATRILADLGARIIKIERPGTGDDGRALPPFKADKSAHFAALNHSKASIALDLKSEAGQEIAERLVARADIIVEGFRPGVMDKFGLGYEALQARHPRLIYGSISGYGQTGPDAKRPSYDVIAEARGGVMAETGERGGEPVRLGAPIGDIAASMYLVQGILAALFDRERTGQGRRIDVAMLDAQLSLQSRGVAQSAVGGKTPEPRGTRSAEIAPSEAVATSDGRIVLAAGNDRLFEKLCTALNLPLSDDARFATNADRVQNARLLRRLIEAVTLEKTRAHWLARLTAAGIPCAPVQGIDEAMKDPQITARNMVVDVLDRNGRKAYLAPGNPIKMSSAEDRTVRTPAPDLDGNRGEILRWLDGE
ncbi:Formyl-coenzyme A transferase [Roseivivax sp. THAF40]|uniref:CaiB/BaiF CoA transferase family protein n=1 Tax=unclassified Roseivivax TaxID=2639302 RepID=UPI0012685749|nr:MULTISPECIES: CoA transferase [unclassified Roseivivax]QFS83385.1 Formyl-coenzyme A transferase [Roseivivax sp. THAF197b]QFT47129.1 Formyl-coenzyme A transferase [Roseivivax sp. THAF40]